MIITLFNDEQSTTYTTWQATPKNWSRKRNQPKQDNLLILKLIASIIIAEHNINATQVSKKLNINRNTVINVAKSFGLTYLPHYAGQARGQWIIENHGPVRYGDGMVIVNFITECVKKYSKKSI